MVDRELPLGSAAPDLEGVRSSEPSPCHVAHQREREAWVRSCLERMAPEDRAVIVLREGEGLSFSAAGERLGISPDTARKRFERSMARLGHIVRQLGGGTLPEPVEEG
jgi:RNA polymerase sigma factor (sigma-70 family)